MVRHVLEIWMKALERKPSIFQDPLVKPIFLNIAVNNYYCSAPTLWTPGPTNTHLPAGPLINAQGLPSRIADHRKWAKDVQEHIERPTLCECYRTRPYQAPNELLSIVVDRA